MAFPTFLKSKTRKSSWRRGRVSIEMRTYHVPPSPSSGVKGLFSKPRNDKGMTQDDFERVVAGGIETVRLVLKRLKERVEARADESSQQSEPHLVSPAQSLRNESAVSARFENSAYDRNWGIPQEKALHRYKLQRPFTKAQLNDACFDLFSRVPEELRDQVRTDYDTLLPFAS